MKNLNPSNKEIIVKSYTKDSTLESKSNLKVYKDNPKALDSQSLIPQLFNPKFLDSNSNLKPLYSRINVKTHSKFLDSNLKNPKFLNYSLVSSSTLFLSLSLITALNTSLGADSWATSGTINISNSGTIDTITNTSGVNNKIIGNQAGKTYNDLIINNGITLQNNGNGNTLQLNNASAGTIENQGLIKKQNNSSAVAIENNATLGTFKNTGTIEAVGNAVNVYINKSTLTDFSNSGTIKGEKGIQIGISTLTNFSNSGVIISSKDDNNTIALQNTKIQTFTNTGTIEKTSGGASGVAIENNTALGTFINQGIINHKGNGPGVYVGSKATIENFENKGTIESKQKDGIEVNNSTITNFKNSGTIQGGWSGMFINGAIIQTLINEGSIISKSSNGADAGIGLQGGGTIATIINKGTIRSNAFGIGVVNGKFGKLIMQDGAVVVGVKYSGIIVGLNQTLGDLEISGANTKISGGQNGIFLSGNSKTQKITIKDGARIEGGNNGILLRKGANLSGDINISGGAKIKGGQNGIVAHTGAKISGDINISGGARIEGEWSGINIWDNTELSGDILISGQGSMIKGGKDAGIFNENSKITGNITISDGATITATSGKAIWNNENSTLSGGITISGANTKLEGNIVNSDNANIGSEIKIEKGASINGGLVNNGNASISGNITIDESSKLNSITNTSTNANAITGSIETKSSTPLAISNSGSIGGDIKTAGNAELKINNSGSGSIGGAITASGDAPISITNSDNATLVGGVSASGGGKVSIENKGSANIAGEIKVSDDVALNIKNTGNATLQSDIINSGSGALSLSNTGNASIGANIKNEGSGSLSINNTGKVSDTTKIESNGSGKVEVQEWLVSANSKGEVKPLEITGSNLSVVSVSNVTFDAGNITNLSSLVNDPKNVINIDTSKDTSISNPAEINSKVFAKAEFKTNDPSVNINLDAVSKTLSFSIDGAKTSAAALGKTLISNTQARANFVNSVMGNAMNAVHLIHNQGSANVYSNFNKAYEEGAIYANFDNLASDALLRTSSENKDKNHLAFMLPYISKSDTSLNGGLTSKGHTKGVIFGYSYLNPNNKDIYGIYGGYDDFSSKTYPSDILALNNRTYYAGVRYYHPFNYKDYELFSKFSSQFGLIQNDIYERVGQTEFKGEPKSYAYDANVNMGMNIKLNTKHTLTPEIGLGYNGGFTKAYELNNISNTIKRRTYTHKMNLFKTKTSLSFYSDWHKHFKTLVYAGVDWTINPNVANPKGRYSNIGYYGGGESKLDNLEYALGTTLVIPLNDAFYFSLNYGMNWTKNTTMHTGYGKFNYMW